MFRRLGPDWPVLALILVRLALSRRPALPLTTVAMAAGHALLVLFVIAARPAAAAMPVVSDMRVSEHAAMTRVVLTLSGPVKYQAFTLHNPHRVVLDLPAVRWTARLEAAGPAGSVVERIRQGRFSRETARVVIDCRTAVEVRNVSLQQAPAGGYRLLIDMTATAGRESAPAAGGGAEMRPAIGATSLTIDDLLSSPPPGRAAETIPVRAAALAVPKPRPHKAANAAVPQWVVAIDAGHGAQDPGATSLHGVQEKQITLATARALRDELKTLGRYRVVMTRDSDTFIRLRGRIAIARAAGADLFVSLHADSTENPATRGLSVYTLSERASDAEAAALAEKENRVDSLGGFRLKGEAPDVTDILIDLVQRDTKNQSVQLAALVEREAGEETALLPQTHRFAGFAVLKATDIPSVLIELGFLSNPADERLLRDAGHRARLARAIARAIDGYFVRFEARNRY